MSNPAKSPSSVKKPGESMVKSPSGFLGPPAGTLNRKLSVPRKNVFAVAIDLVKELKIQFLKTPNARLYDKFIVAFGNIARDANLLEPVVYATQKIAELYDFDEKTPGNGYRSLVCLVDTALLHLIGLMRIIEQRRLDLTFRTTYYCKEIETYAKIVNFLMNALSKIIQSKQLSTSVTLFHATEVENISDKMFDLMNQIENLDVTCFYGRAIGFHYCASVTRVFNVIGVALATYSSHWTTGSGKFTSAISAGRFWLSPETCAKQIVTTTQRADIGFCKAFWNLSEMGIMQKMPDWFCPVLFMNDVMQIPAEYNQFMEKKGGGQVTIPPPSAHTGFRAINARFLASQPFKGIETTRRVREWKPASPYLIFNCHGGGFVATTSKSHETYLRQWAKMLECPILSIDYSLAPENPYPRATEEGLYAYAWAINHRHLLGWTGEKVCFVGDSAGGNLLVSVTLKLIMLGVSRLPDALVPIYTPFLFQYSPSPSRVLSLLDPLLPTGIVLRCVAAYTGNIDLVEKWQEPNGTTNNNKKSLQEYFDEAQSQRAQYEKVEVGETNDVVNLINITNKDQTGTKAKVEYVLHLSIEYLFIFEERNEENVSDEWHDASNEQTPIQNKIVDEHVLVPQVAVHRKDGERIWMTTSIHSDEVVDYLSQHPMTKDHVMIVQMNYPINNVATTIAKTPLAASASVTSLASSDGVNSPIDSSPTNGHKPLHRTEIELIDPSQPNRVLAETRTRTWSSSVSDTIALATGHATDVAAGLIEQTTSFPADFTETMDKLKRMSVPKDPLISPLYASDQVLAQMPPVYLVGCHMDPLLDDSIEFGKKLRKAGGKVEVALLDSLPHGFLNFTLMSAECREGAKVCVDQMRTALNMDIPNNETVKKKLSKA